MAKGECDFSGAEPGGVDVALNLAQGDRTLRQRAVGVKNGILRILPALLHQASGGTAEVFHEAVAIPIAIAVHPVQSHLDVGPYGTQKIEVARALVVGGGEHDEQGRRVDAAVIAVERDFAQQRHLAFARFMQDLTGLGVLPGKYFRRLVGGKIIEHSPG